MLAHVTSRLHALDLRVVRASPGALVGDDAAGTSSTAPRACSASDDAGGASSSPAKNPSSSPRSAVVTVSHRPVRGVLWRVAQHAWGFALAHYIFFGPVLAFAALALARRSVAAACAMALAVALYLPSFLDGAHATARGRPWDALRVHPVWQLSQSYLGARLVRTRALPGASEGKKYVFAWHPHGILILSRILCYGGAWEALFPDHPFRVLGATPMFFLPGCREICLWMGAVDAGARTAREVLRSNRSVVVYPGGSREIFDTDPRSRVTKITLKRRKGFVRLALAEGAELVPVFVFGEKRCYSRLNVPAGIRDSLLAAMKVPVIVFWGRFGTWYPKDVVVAKRSASAKKNTAVSSGDDEDEGVGMTAVFGAPIPTSDAERARDEATGRVSEEAVDAVHARYVEAVRRLFEEHKGEAGYGPEETLEVV